MFNHRILSLHWHIPPIVNDLTSCLPGPPPVADVASLTHYGEPYDGNTRYFRSTLFVAAVRSCYGESCLLHGVEWMPPKVYLLCCFLGYLGSYLYHQTMMFPWSFCFSIFFLEY